MHHREDPSSNSMTPCIVQRIARQALATFRLPCPGHGASFLDNHSMLRSLMEQVRAEDLRLVPRKGDGRPAGSAVHPFHGAPPVTYMHICETEDFSMGVFLLGKGASIPLHDHPGMHGLLKVMYGTARITCFDRTDHPGAASGAAPLSSSAAPPPASWFQRGALRRSLLRSEGEYTEESGPCVLAPHDSNLHRIDAVDGPTAFLDILAPPYEPDDGRDCHYYKVLPPPAAVAPSGGGDGAGSEGRDPPPREEEEVWLMEISQPADFWCGSEQYPGPHVTL